VWGDCRGLGGDLGPSITKETPSSGRFGPKTQGTAFRGAASKPILSFHPIERVAPRDCGLRLGADKRVFQKNFHCWPFFSGGHMVPGCSHDIGGGTKGGRSKYLGYGFSPGGGPASACWANGLGYVCRLGGGAHPNQGLSLLFNHLAGGRAGKICWERE